MCSKMLLVALLLTGSAALAQSTSKDSPGLPRKTVRPLARLSYKSVGAVAYGDTTSQSSSICFELERDGHYRLARLTRLDGREIYQGNLSADDLSQVSEMLKSVEFTKPFGGGPVLRGSESLVAEISRNEETIHAHWLDPDRKQPFPAAVLKIVDWLQHFKVEDATRLDDNGLGTSSICPGWEEPLRPQSAKLECPYQQTPRSSGF